MATLMLPDLARDMAALNRRAANAVEAERRQLVILQHETEEWPALQQRIGRGARQAIRQAVGNAPGAQAIWQTALEIMQGGLSGESFKELLQDVRDVIETWLTLAENARAMGSLAAGIGATALCLEELHHKEAEIRAVRVAIEQIGAFSTPTRAPVDRALLQQGRTEIDQGKMKSAAQMLAGRDAQGA